MEEAAGVLAGYLESMSPVWLAEHVTLIDARTGRSYAGRPGAVEWLRRARLAGSQAGDIHLVVSGAHAAAEWLLPLQGGETVPMAAFAVVEAGEISALRVYPGGRPRSGVPLAEPPRSKEGKRHDPYR